jgi:DNA-directed RNA polymerase omega subunit
MSVVYLEDVIKIVGNKYLAINIAAQRARQLNEKGIPLFTQAAPRKPASLAIEELVEGKIGYTELSPLEQTQDDLSPFHSSADQSERAEALEDVLPDLVYVNDSNIEDLDEGEEGL